MLINLEMPQSLQQELTVIITNVTKEVFNTHQEKETQREWMDLKTGAKYAGVSDATFVKFRSRGLKVVEIDGVKRVSKTAVDNFYRDNEF